MTAETEKILTKFAELLVRKGVNLQKGQLLVITSDVQNAGFVNLVTDAGYAAGASEVAVLWNDEYNIKQLYLHAADFVFDEVPGWVQARYDYFSGRDACYVQIVSDDPELLKDASPDKVSRKRTANAKANERWRKQTMSSEVRWSIAALPSPAWAAKVFPGVPAGEAEQKLWKLMAKCSRIDNDDPIAAWDKHNDNFQARLNFLNERKIKQLRYKNSLGTDLTVEIPEAAVWIGGGEPAKDGVMFFPNIPTEEIYTMPKRNGVNGRVVASKPLINAGHQIDGLELTFKDGRVTESTAKTNAELLAQLIDTDEGSHYLGEVALVPYHSPISETGTLFYHTLFDENAACHFAIGRAYPTCLAGSDNMTDAQLAEAGANHSLVHVDFMVGTPDLSITAIDKDGNEIAIFTDGDFS